MFAFYICILILIVLGLHKKSTFDLESALELKQTNTVKGIFILLVFLSHIRPYILQSGHVFNKVDEMTFGLLDIGQNVVIMFLFYSGYGMHQQIKKRGEQYIKRIPLHRIGSTLLNFDVAVLAFFVLALLQKTPLSTCRTLLAFSGWESLGNSNWYIFDILVLYSLVWLTHFTVVKQTLLQWLTFSALILLFTITMFMTKPDYWSDTILCFWGGYSLSCFKERIQSYFERHWGAMLALCIISFGFFHCCLLGCWHLHHGGFTPAWMKLPWLWLNLKHLSVAFGIILLTIRVGCKSKPLEWCGQHLFPIYIYQRLPMMAIPSSFIAFCPIGYVASCLVVTLCIAALYKYWQIRL